MEICQFSLGLFEALEGLCRESNTVRVNEHTRDRCTLQLWRVGKMRSTGLGVLVALKAARKLMFLPFVAKGGLFTKFLAVAGQRLLR